MQNAVIDISERINAAMQEAEREEHSPIVLPEPGVFRDMDFLDYARIDAASQSRLNKLVPPSTPAHCLAYMQTPPKKTDALIIGEATHCAILEPDAFPRRFIRAIEGDGRTKAVKEAREAQAQMFPDSCVLSPADYDTTIAVRDAVWSHPAARALLELKGENELSMVWRDDGSGETCKGRIDRITPDINTIIDLKSTRNASRDNFAGSVKFYGYHRQAAMYEDGALFSGLGKIENYVFIAFEKVPPFAVAVYRLNDNDIVAGGADLAQLLALYAKCRRENHWPAYSEAIEDITIAAAAAGSFNQDF